MAEKTSTPNSSFWRSRETKVVGALAAATVAGAGILFLVLRDEDSEKTPKPETTTTVPTTTTTAPQLEPFSFAVGSQTYNCEIAEEPHVVTGGEGIWEIVEEQQTDIPMPDIWRGTVELNKARGNVGSNPDLIYRGNEIDLLVNCRQ